MINIDFTNIDNAKMIGRLLPFWARGRKTALLLQALLRPIITAHNRFQTWALDKYIEYHITAQSPSLEWYLKYKLGSHFYNHSDSFSILYSGTRTEDATQPKKIQIIAPDIVDTIDYNHEDYERDIRNIVSKFMICFKKVNIKINTQH